MPHVSGATISLPSGLHSSQDASDTVADRREKRGWLGDALDASEQGFYNFDMLAVQSAFMQSIRENQSPGGDVPAKIPGKANFFDTTNPPHQSCTDIAWTSAWPRITNMLHEHYGDRTIVQRMWPGLVRYTENLIAHSNTSTPVGLSTCDTYQDW